MLNCSIGQVLKPAVLAAEADWNSATRLARAL